MGRPLVYLSVPTVRLVDRQRETPLRGAHSSRFRPGIISGLEPPTAMRVFADVKIMRDVKRIASGSMLITATCLDNLHTRCKLSRQVWRAPLPWGRATDLVLFPLLIASLLMSLNLIDALPLSYPTIGENCFGGGKWMSGQESNLELSIFIVFRRYSVEWWTSSSAWFPIR